MAARWTQSDRARIDFRRLWVEKLFVRGMTMREIEAKLPERGILNPDSGKPYGLGTVSRDVQVIKERWKEEAAADVAEVKASQLAELREARRKAWSDSNVAEVRRNLDLETDLTGTKAPKAVKVGTLTDDDLDAAIATELARLAAVGEAADVRAAEGDADTAEAEP